MSKVFYYRHRFPPSVIHRSVWLYFRFPLSFRDVEEMLAERNIEVSYETVRRWVLKFGPAFGVANWHQMHDLQGTVRTKSLR